MNRLLCGFSSFAFYLVISGQGRDPVPSTLPVSKLATEIYDSDDGGNRTPPLIPRTVILKPSPSPESLAPSARSLSPECTGTLSRNKGPRRRQKTQPSQGDAVLIGFLGGQNCPDIATRAGEEPLNSASQSEAGDPNSPMDVEDGNPGENKGFNLIQTAQNALLVDGTDKPSGEKGQSPKSDETRRSLSRLQTRDLNASTGDGATLDAVGPIPTKRDSDNQTGPDNPQLFQAPVTDSRSAREESPERSPSTLGRPSTIRRSSSATSPLRKYAIAPSERSPMELLPAMQTSQPSLSAQSPSGQQTLPPLHSQFPNLVEDRSTNDKKSRTNVINTNRPHIPLLNSSLNSPPLTSLGTRPGQYPSPQTRLNGHFPHPYPPSQPSPASSYSDTSPRDNYRPNSDTSSLSPRGRFAPNQFYSNRRTSKSGELTPLSAESHKTSGKFGTDTSPDSDRVNVESGRPVLPPLGSSAPIVAGLFKCEHAGCTASPFQTQYLLK